MRIRLSPYVTTENDGIQIINVSDPAHPVIAGSYVQTVRTGVRVVAFSVQYALVALSCNNRAYVAGGREGLFDLTLLDHHIFLPSLIH